jgi:hypothetical protein
LATSAAAGFFSTQTAQRVVEKEPFLIGRGSSIFHPAEIDALAVAPVLLRFLAAGVFDHDAAHGLGRGGKEVAAAVPVSRLLYVYQPQVGLVNQGRRLQRLAGLLLSEFLRRELAQLLVDQGQELLGGVRIASFNVGQDAGNLIHR